MKLHELVNQYCTKAEELDSSMLIATVKEQFMIEVVDNGLLNLDFVLIENGPLIVSSVVVDEETLQHQLWLADSESTITIKAAVDYPGTFRVWTQVHKTLTE